MKNSYLNKILKIVEKDIDRDLILKKSDGKQGIVLYPKLCDSQNRSYSKRDLVKFKKFQSEYIDLLQMAIANLKYGFSYEDKKKKYNLALEDVSGIQEIFKREKNIKRLVAILDYTIMIQRYDNMELRYLRYLKDRYKKPNAKNKLDDNVTSSSEIIAMPIGEISKGINELNFNAILAREDVKESLLNYCDTLQNNLKFLAHYKYANVDNLDEEPEISAVYNISMQFVEELRSKISIQKETKHYSDLNNIFYYLITEHYKKTNPNEDTDYLINTLERKLFLKKYLLVSDSERRDTYQKNYQKGKAAYKKSSSAILSKVLLKQIKELIS